MKLILHIVGKDLRRMRGWIGAWLLLLATSIVITTLAMHRAESDPDTSTIKNINTTAMLLQVLVGYLMVLVLMQDDAVIGTRQFWLTRPIARWRLLVAKLLAALLMVGGGAVAVGIPWWLYCGFGPLELARVTTEYLVLALLVVVPAMLMGVLTDSLARAILWSFALFAVVIMMAGMFSMGVPPQAVPMILTRVATGMGLWVLEALAVVALVFLTRKRWWAAIGGICALLTPGLVWLVWPPAWVNAREPRELNPQRGASVQVKFESGWSAPARGPGGRDVAMDHLRVSFSATRPGNELRLQGVGARQTWRWGKTEFNRDAGLNTLESITVPGYQRPAPDAPTEAWRAEERAKAAERARNRPPAKGAFPPRPAEGIWLQAYAPVPSSWPARMSTEPSVYRAKLWMALLRSVVRNEIPVRSGASGSGQAHRAVITRAVNHGSQIAIDTIEFVPNLLITEPRETARALRWYQDVWEPAYFLLNPARREFRSLSSSRRRTLAVHGVRVTCWVFTTVDGRVWRDGALVEPEGWLEGAMLGYVGMEAESVFAREVQVEGFTVERIKTPL